MSKSVKFGWLIIAVVLFVLSGCGGEEAINDAGDETSNNRPAFYKLTCYYGN